MLWFMVHILDIEAYIENWRLWQWTLDWLIIVKRLSRALNWLKLNCNFNTMGGSRCSCCSRTSCCLRAWRQSFPFILNVNDIHHKHINQLNTSAEILLSMPKNSYNEISRICEWTKSRNEYIYILKQWIGAQNIDHNQVIIRSYAIISFSYSQYLCVSHNIMASHSLYRSPLHKQVQKGQHQGKAK